MVTPILPTLLIQAAYILSAPVAARYALERPLSLIHATTGFSEASSAFIISSPAVEAPPGESISTIIPLIWLFYSIFVSFYVISSAATESGS